MARKFGAGSRRLAKTDDGRMSRFRKAWFVGWLGQITMFAVPQDADEPDPDEGVTGNYEPEYGTTVRLFYPQPGRRPVSINLTAATEEELHALFRFMLHAYRTALPVVRERDRIAREAYARGDDLYARLYRRSPQFIIRGGEERPHDQGVPPGPPAVSSGDGGPGDGDLRGEGDALAEPAPPGGVSQDDDVQAD